MSCLNSLTVKFEIRPFTAIKIVIKIEIIGWKIWLERAWVKREENCEQK